MDFHNMTVKLMAEKTARLRQQLSCLLEQPTTTAKQLEQVLGMLMWFTSIAKHLRPHLAEIYRCLYAPPATLFSIPASSWAAFVSGWSSKDSEETPAFCDTHRRSPGGNFSPAHYLQVGSPRAPRTSKLQWIRIQVPLLQNSFQLSKGARHQLRPMVPPDDPKKGAHLSFSTSFTFGNASCSRCVCRRRSIWHWWMDHYITSIGSVSRWIWRKFASLCPSWQRTPRNISQLLRYWPNWPYYSWQSSTWLQKKCKSAFPLALTTQEQKQESTRCSQRRNLLPRSSRWFPQWLSSTMFSCQCRISQDTWMTGLTTSAETSWNSGRHILAFAVVFQIFSPSAGTLHCTRRDSTHRGSPNMSQKNVGRCTTCTITQNFFLFLIPWSLRPDLLRGALVREATRPSRFRSRWITVLAQTEVGSNCFWGEGLKVVTLTPSED